MSDSPVLNEQQREELLDQIYQTSGTVGRSIPETIRLGDESVPLRKFYFEVSDREELQEEDRESIEEILSYLRRKRLALIQRIQKREVDYETGKTLVPKIRDLDRAINAFESLDDPSFEEQLRQHKIRSARELIELMREFGKM